ncbi:Paratox [Streptococcus sp. E17BB]|uniref:competence regulator inhibitor paratox n=1 Tax=Streptococcus sp. E17BB TaxID=3278714 RepID=UPI00359DBEF7
MLCYEELREAVDNGYIIGDTLNVVRKNGKVFDYALPGEPVRPWEIVTVESLIDIMTELSNYQ